MRIPRLVPSLKTLIHEDNRLKAAIVAIAIAIPVLLFLLEGWFFFFKMVLPFYFILTCGYLISKIAKINSHFQPEETLLLSVAVGVSLFVVLSSVVSAFPLPWNSFILFGTGQLTLIILIVIQYRSGISRSEYRKPIDGTLKKTKRYFFLVSLLLSFLIAIFMIKNLLQYPYFNASDPFVNAIFNRAIQSKEVTILANSSTSPYLNVNVRGFFFFASFLSTLGFDIFTFTRFAGPVLFFFLNIFLSFAAYRFLKRRIAFLLPLIFATNSYLVYRFLMALPEEFSLFLFGAMLLVLSNEAYFETKRSTLVIAIILSAIVTTHILIGVFAILFLLSLFIGYGVFDRKSQASSILIGIIGGLTISISYPRVLLETVLFELQNIARNLLDFGKALVFIENYAIVLDLVFLCIGLSAISLLQWKRLIPLFARKSQRIYHAFLVILLTIFLISETYLLTHFSSSAMIGPSSFVLINNLLLVCGLIAIGTIWRGSTVELRISLCSLFFAIAILLIAATASIASPRLQSYPNQAPETVRLIPQAQIIISILVLIGLDGLFNVFKRVKVVFCRPIHRLSKINMKIVFAILISLLLVVGSFNVVTATTGWSRWRQNDLELALWLKVVSNSTSVILPQSGDELLLSYVGIDPNQIDFNVGRRIEIFNSSSNSAFLSSLDRFYANKTIVYIFESEDWLPIMSSIQLPSFIKPYVIKDLSDAHIYQISIGFQVGKAIVSSSGMGNLTFLDYRGNTLNSVDLKTCTEVNLAKHQMNLNLLLQNSNASDVAKVEFLLYNNLTDNDNDTLPNIKITFLSPNSASPFAYSNTLYYDYNDSDSNVGMDATSERVYFTSGLTLYSLVGNKYTGYNLYPPGHPGETVKTLSGYGLPDDKFTYSLNNDTFLPYRFAFAVLFPANTTLDIRIFMTFP